MKQLYVIYLVLAGSCDAFVQQTRNQIGISALDKASIRFMSSYEVDSDEDAEQRLGEAPTFIQTDGAPSEEKPLKKVAEEGRYDDVLAAVGLKGKLKHTGKLPKERIVSSYDIFCNRELRQEAITAIGFDMVSVRTFFVVKNFLPLVFFNPSSHFFQDYTLVQYQQPAFDQLAFDGAKEKLVNNLGYPKEVLDFEYNHKVRFSKDTLQLNNQV